MKHSGWSPLNSRLGQSPFEIPTNQALFGQAVMFASRRVGLHYWQLSQYKIKIRDTTISYYVCRSCRHWYFDPFDRLLPLSCYRQQLRLVDWFLLFHVFLWCSGLLSLLIPFQTLLMLLWQCCCPSIEPKWHSIFYHLQHHRFLWAFSSFLWRLKTSFFWSSHPEVFLQIGVPVKWPKFLRNTCEEVHFLVKLLAEGLQLY